jgi:Ig-like domain-containing protein/prolyl oligopeptidase family protein
MKPTQLFLNCLIGLAFPTVALAQPSITTQPESQSVSLGANVTFSVNATGSAPLAYQWQKDSTELVGSTETTLVLTNVQSTHAGDYRVVVTNVGGVVSSAVAHLTVLVPPRITPTVSLQHTPVFVGSRTSFTVTSSGTAPLSYQWRLDGHELLGQTNKTLTLASTQPADEGYYTVVVTNRAGSVINDPVRLWVVPTFAAGRWANFTNAGGLRLPYWCLVPTNYVPTRSYPLICLFHGSPMDETRLPSAFLPAMAAFASYKQQATDPAIVVFPSRRAGDNEWTDQYLQQVFDLLDWLITQFSVDTNRIYTQGASEGVHAAWDALGMRPDFFAAALLNAGWQGRKPASVIKQVPVWVACAADDGLVVDTRFLVRSLRLAGGNPIYTEYNSGGHLGGILMSMSTPAIVDWTLTQRRDLPPATDPLLAITSPTREAIHATGATNLNLGGGAAAPGRDVTKVAWENTANGAKGTASGTNTWSATGVPLRGSRTNLIIITATTTSWAPAYGGNTTFNDALTVIQSPLSATLVLQGTDALLNWTGGGTPYCVQRATDLAVGDWIDFLPNATPPVTLPLTGQRGFYRLVGQ